MSVRDSERQREIGSACERETHTERQTVRDVKRDRWTEREEENNEDLFTFDYHTEIISTCYM